VPSNSPSLVCEVCGARVSTLRRGRCWICYVRWAETRPVGQGASCAICSDRRRDNLRLVEFQGSWVPLCHICGTRAVSLSPVPPSIEGLRQRLSRERRWGDRRMDKPDQRLLPLDRRENERREQKGSIAEWLDAEDLIVEILDMSDVAEPPTEATHISPLLLEDPQSADYGAD
jgi:hypothetical protein